MTCSDGIRRTRSPVTAVCHGNCYSGRSRTRNQRSRHSNSRPRAVRNRSKFCGSFEKGSQTGARLISTRPGPPLWLSPASHFNLRVAAAFNSVRVPCNTKTKRSYMHCPPSNLALTRKPPIRRLQAHTAVSCQPLPDTRDTRALPDRRRTLQNPLDTWNTLLWHPTCCLTPVHVPPEKQEATAKAEREIRRERAREKRRRERERESQRENQRKSL
eukprot:3115694-Rhodomonas_salina.1